MSGKRNPEEISKDRWARKQELAAPSRYYGDGGTIHSTGYLDVETYCGEVVAVWFRCQMLPFAATEVAASRAEDMTAAYDDGFIPALTGVEVLDQR